jgi:hypothetical protein
MENPRTMYRRLLPTAPFSHPPRIARTVAITALLIIALLGSACGTSPLDTRASAIAPGPQAVSLADHPDAGGNPQPASTGSGYPIKVFFSKDPDSFGNDLSAAFPVDRVSPTKAVATFAIQLLIAGPTLAERDQGYFSELNGMFNGESTCTGPKALSGGPDFTLTLEKKGTVSEKGTATLSFCRTTYSAGTGMDARVIGEMTRTLKQFPTITKVAILTKEGHCFGDMSGQDGCLR